MDSLRSTIGLSVALACAFAWAGIAEQEPIQAIGLEISREHAFPTAALFYIFVNAKVLFLLIRLRRLLQSLDDAHFLDGFTRVATHPFFANPFSYFGEGAITRLVSAQGLVFLIFLWWVANGSLYTLSPGSAFELYLGTVFLAFGYGSLLAISRCTSSIEERLSTLDTTLHAQWRRQRSAQIALVIGSLAGGALAATMYVLSR